MADSSPLLSQPNSATDSSERHHLPSLNSTIEQYIGEFNYIQLLQVILISFSWIFDAQQTFISIFTDSQPPSHCTAPVGSSCNSSNICELPDNTWVWDFPLESSIISEWDLQCKSSIITGLPASSFFMGCLVGGPVLATLADSTLGRKNMLFSCCLLMSFASFVSFFSPNVWIYSVLKFVCGFGRAAIGTSALVLATELVGKQQRGQVSILGFFFFAVGFLSLPAIACINRGHSWRNMYIWTSIPTLFYCVSVKFFVQESPRWLLVRGRKEEAVKSLKYITNITQSSLDLTFSCISYEEENSNVDFFSALKMLIQKNWSCRRLFAVMAMGFGIGLVYYGMPLGLGSLSFDIHLSVTFNALSELPSSLLSFVLIDKFKRKRAIMVFTILSGVFSLLSIVEGKPWTKLLIGFELLSFLCACTSLNIFLIYTTELFPTCVRNSALSMARQAQMLGGVFSPMLVAAGRGHKFLSFGVFGLVIGFSGVFGVCLPETRGRALCDTMDEEENKEKVRCEALT